MENIENERFKELQKALGFKSQQQFADALGVTQSNISGIYNKLKGVGVSGAIKKKLADMGVNINWLVTGKGAMLNDVAVAGSHNMVGSSGTMNNIVLNAKKIIDRKADGSVTIKAAATDEERNAEDYLSEIEQLRGRIAELELSLEAEKRAGRNMQDLILRMQKGE